MNRLQKSSQLRMIGLGGFLLFGWLGLVGCRGTQSPQNSNDVQRAIQVYAASSLTDVLTLIRDDYQQRSGQSVEFTLDSSATLAKQIMQGAPADLFLSANREWADQVAQHSSGAVTPIDMLSNRLVVIAAGEQAAPLNELSDLTKIPELRLALANPDSVPAGIYARQALEKAQLWGALRPQVIPADNVRAALQYVETGSASFAIVYATDLSPQSPARVVLEIDSSLHEPIVYPLVVLNGQNASSQVRAFADYLQSDEAAKRFTDRGFTRILAPGR